MLKKASDSVKDAVRNSVQFENSEKKSTSKMTPEERRAYAEAHGLKGRQLESFVNADRSNPYHDTFWDKFRKFFGGKLGSESYQEDLDLADSALLNELILAQSEDEYNSPEQQVAREQAAGLNPDLAPGSIGAGEAAQIDDEVLGSGLAESMSTAHQSAIDMPLNVANAVMDSAASVLSLITGGFNISNTLFSMDQAEVTNLFEFSRLMNDLGGYLPMLGIDYDDANKAFISDGRQLTMEQMSEKTYNEIAKKIANYRHPRTRRQVRQMFNNFKSNKAAESYYATKTGQKKLTKEYAGFGKELAELTGSFDSQFEWLMEDPHYKATLDLCTDLYNIGLESQRELARYQTEYYKALNSGDGATAEAMSKRWDSAIKSWQSSLQDKVYGKMADWINDLTKDDPNGIGKLLMFSVMSGGFKQLGFASPFELPAEIVDKMGSAIDWISNFIPGLGALKGATRGAEAAQSVITGNKMMAR